MTTASNFQSENLSINVFQSIPAGGSYLETLSVSVDQWQHEIRAVGGYWSGQFTIRDRQSKVENWLDGLGRRIEVRDEVGELIWEGFVNRVTVAAGPLSVERGPLTAIVNKVKVVYSELDTSVNPPVLGDTVFSSASENTDSQTLYGVIEKTVAVGGVTQTEAEQTRDTYLAENAFPETSSQFSLGQGDAFSVSVECLGYIHWLDLYPYNQETDTSTINLSAKIQDALAADPNGFISTDYSRLTSNTVQVPDYDNRDLSAWGIIKDLIAKGDASDNRYNFGIYEDRIAVYEAVPTDIEYQLRLGDPEQRIENIVGGRVKPWNVLPGKWCFFPDFLVGIAEPASLKEDPRALFIESVVFRLPRGIQLTGSKVSSLQQKINRLGLQGLAA